MAIVFHFGADKGTTSPVSDRLGDNGLTDGALRTLEMWQDLRIRRERERLDHRIEHFSDKAPCEGHEASAWWRSWRACTRRR